MTKDDRISDFYTSVRLDYELMKLNINTVGDLLSYSKEELTTKIMVAKTKKEQKALRAELDELSEIIEKSME